MFNPIAHNLQHTGAPGDDSSCYPGAFQAWRVVVVIFMASVVSTIDRGIFSLVIDPIRHDLQISDVQISLLQGLSFGILYATAGIALGLTADRYSRRRLLALGVLVWSLATALGGMAQNFEQMFATRVMVGLGEAALGPCMVSMVADLFPPNRRGRPISICLMGQAAGVGLSVLLAGLILSIAPARLPAMFPSLAQIAPWRLVFMICGLIGLVVVGLILSIREPARRGARLNPVAGSRLRAAADYFRRDIGVFLPLYLSFAIVSAGFYGTNAWSAAFIIRAYGLSAPETGHALGLATIVGGFAGALIAGNFVDIFARSGGAPRKLKLLVLTPFCALPSCCAIFAPNAAMAIILIPTMLAGFQIYSTTFMTALQDMTPNEMRGIGIAIAGLMNAIIGAVLGPLFIALATEHVYHDPKLVGWGIASVTAPALAVGALLAFVAARNMRLAPRGAGGLRNVALET
jgi:MFS family permease